MYGAERSNWHLTPICDIAPAIPGPGQGPLDIGCILKCFSDPVAQLVEQRTFNP
jgi:hypothetical protein